MSEVNKIIESIAKDIFKTNETSILVLKQMLNELRQTQLDQAALRRYDGNYQLFHRAQVEQQAMINLQQLSNTTIGRTNNE